MTENKKQKYADATYKDVFLRIANSFGDEAYLSVGDVNGRDVYEGCDTYDEVDVEADEVLLDVGDDCSDCVLKWKSIKSFLTAEKSDGDYLLSIFKMLAYWGCNYERLDRYKAAFYDNFNRLKNIKPKDNSPASIMKCLDLENI